MRIMGDGVTLSDIPLTWNGQPVSIIGCYRNGIFAADPALLNQLFPASRFAHVWIDVNGSCPESAQVLDVEPGDDVPAHAPAWVKARRAVVHTSLPTLYCDRSHLEAVQQACAAAGLKSGTDYQLWVATLDGTEDFNGRPLREIPGVVAVQVEGGPAAKWDRSVVYDDKWHPLA